MHFLWWCGVACRKSGGGDMTVAQEFLDLADIDTKAKGLFQRPPPEGQGAQLGLLCACGCRPIELRGLRCCRLCYCRQYDSLRWFGGLRELILKRDRFRCRACESARRIVVHHRDESNASPLLITLCIRCHVRLHHSRRFRSWVPEVLLGLWNELHPSAPLQMQLPFAVKRAAASAMETCDPSAEGRTKHEHKV